MGNQSNSSTVRRIDTQYFSSTLRSLDGAIRLFDQTLDTVEQQTKQLRSSWEGRGADKFNRAYNRLKREFDDQSETLAAIRDDLQIMLSTYEEWDQTTKKDISL